MNVILKTPFIIALFFGLATVNSCTKTCDEGYEGNRCDVEIREKFVGVWNATDEPGHITFSDTITKGTLILDVSITGNLGSDSLKRPVKATVAGNLIKFTSQRPNPARPVLVEGSGTINESHTIISWTYSLSDTSFTPPAVTTYNGVWTK